MYNNYFNITNIFFRSGFTLNFILILIENLNGFNLTQKENLLNQNYEKMSLMAEPLLKDLNYNLMNVKNNFHVKNRTSWCHIPPIKTKKSLDIKLKLKDKNLEEITDFVRASFIVNSIEDINEAFLILKNLYGEPLSQNNNFLNPRINGYRDLKLIFYSAKFNLPFEIQIHLCNIFKVKEVEHVFYKLGKLLKIVSKNFYGLTININNSKILYHYENYAKILLGEILKIKEALNFNDIEILKYLFDNFNNKIFNIKNNFNYLIFELENNSRKIYEKAFNDYLNNEKCLINSNKENYCNLDIDFIKKEAIEYLAKFKLC